ncbi:MAG: hypothetical protein IT258_09370 [Saprospiraceae bacterium]|nr:hypothetical protein [Saprospiraceae bacterium]
MKRIDLKICLILLAISLLVACERKPAKTKEQVMQERLAERLERWKTDMEKKCRKEIETKAIAITDSIVIVQAKQNRDTSIQSIIPGRPTRPDYKPPTDSVAVKPFLKK